MPGKSIQNNPEKKIHAKQQNWKNAHQKENRGKIKPYFTASLAAAVISLVIWPFSIKHIFFDSFGASTFSNAASGDFLHKVTVYLKIVADSLFAGQPILLALFSLAAIAGILWILRKYKAYFVRPNYFFAK